MTIDLATRTGQRIADASASIATLSDTARAYFDTDPAEFPTLGRTVHVYDDMVGNWHFIGGGHEPLAIIRAGSECDALDIYMTEFLGNEEPEDEKDLEHGTFDGEGGWHSECTMSYVMFLPMPTHVIAELTAD